MKSYLRRKVNNWIAIPLTALVTMSLIMDVRRGKLHKSLEILRTIRPVMILSNLPIITLVVVTGVALSSLPILGWSWMSLLSGDGSNVALIGFKYIWFVPFFALLLIAALPLLAEFEEEVFRLGTVTWKQGIKRSILFGVYHTLAGISLGFALALSIGGLWFTHQYFKGGMVRSTAYHTAWNLTLVGTLVVFTGAGMLH